MAGRREEVLAAAGEEIGGCARLMRRHQERRGAGAIVGECLERFGRLDVLVNNAGGQYFVPAEAIEPKGWRAVTGLNLGGTSG